MKPTIAFVTGDLSGGGAERQLLYLLRGLQEYPVRLTLATLHPGDPGEAAIRALGVPVHGVPHSRWKLDRVARLAAWLRREQPVLVHSWAFHGNIYAAWAGALAGVPVRLGSLQGDLFYENRVQWKAPPLFVRLGLTAPHAVMVNSGAAAEAVAARGPRGARLRVIRNGMDTALFRDPAHSSAGVSRGRGGAAVLDRGDAAGPILAQVGSLIARKNVPMFLRVVADLAERHPGIQGWLIGDGPERAALEALAEQLGIAARIRFWGKQADVAGLLGRVDLLCHCSYSEGICNVIMEGSALGLPVIVTRAGGVTEIVEDGVTGVLVNADDDTAMVEQIDRLLGDPARRARMGAAGREKMERDFSLERLAREMVAFYREAMEQRGLRGVIPC